MQKIRNIKKNLLVLSRKNRTSILGAAFKKNENFVNVFLPIPKSNISKNPWKKLCYGGLINNVKLSFLKSHLKFDQHSGGCTLYDSNKLDVNCGVPQGSTLGPLLFLIYINDLRYSLKFCSTSHFADDTCIIYASNKPKTLETNINHNLNKLTEWLGLIDFLLMSIK